MAVADRPRYRLIDALRGAALVAMIGYHIGWDLFYFGVLQGDITAMPGWVAAQLSILGSFVLLAGMSLVLAHGETIRWRSFWRREAILVAAALAVSVGTYIAFGQYFSFFGVLHAIALFSLLALPFLRAPLWIVAPVTAAVIAAPFLWTDPAFMNPWLAWIGFWREPPLTVDLVPIFPWFGVTLAGVILMRLVLASPLRATLASWRGGPIGRGLAVIGRWSLIIYLLHQPLIYGAFSAWFAVFPLAPITLEIPPLTPAQEFSMNCTPSCTETGAPEAYCTAYCACALEQIGQADLWEALGADVQTPEQQSQTSQVINLCRAMAGDE
jgi:uncharacterized membrane protein